MPIYMCMLVDSFGMDLHAVRLNTKIKRGKKGWEYKNRESWDKVHITSLHLFI